MRRVGDFISNLHLKPRFFISWAGVVVVMGMAYVYPWLMPVAWGLCGLLLVLILADIFMQFGTEQVFEASRTMARMLSLHDPNPVQLRIHNLSKYALQCEIRDELPTQLQVLDFVQRGQLKPQEEREFSYHIRPMERGEYHFGKLNILTTTALGLIQRRHRLLDPVMVPVFPSVIQMRHYDLMAFSQVSTQEGIKKVRRVGHSYEFDRIKSYVMGDDIRSINWKATGRRSSLMVNQYEDERAQQIYCVLEKGRSMHMPFDGLSLFDYAVNTSLVLTNIALKKHDKAGLITFSDRLGSTVKAERTSKQLKIIMNSLYHEKAREKESNFDMLYHALKNMVQQRSLILLFMNVESEISMNRRLPVLRKIARRHLLVVIMFENTELTTYTGQKVLKVNDIYGQTIARKMSHEKISMVRKMRKMGIQTIYTAPSDLSMKTVNKYLELKGKGLI